MRSERGNTMRSIKDRVAALEAALLPRVQHTSYAAMDPLSQALLDVVGELKALDTPEKKAAYCEKYGMRPSELESFIHALTA